ncbi:HAD-IIA family hydrolase [Demequina muriae]|uniref:HAD-IIA family hydrolase n=1 Tax=Demequina muriae TaxID=3051664 RepID=A0ABT8GD84_9MICO|nr:HAD-IIA family hydrolase [Demequina sp. EGI L300058]MDN4479393.1 HAD-IIA family hydrolase [Demequina sp. EGI L300058]
MTASDLRGSDEPLFTAFDAALVDLDGVAYRGPHAIPSAPPALAAAREAGMSVVFVTNNASREPETVAAHLTDLGMPAEVDEVMTAAQAVAALMRESLDAGASVYVVGGAGLRTAVTQAGYRIVDAAEPTPDAVVQGFSPDVSWREMAEASYAIRAGARYFASNKDLTIPNERGVAPGNGALINVVVTATGVEPPGAGKPEPAMFRLAAAKVDAELPLVVGDRLDTDLKGARAADMPGLQVLTGVDGVREAILAPPAHRPSFLGRDLTALADPHPHPEREGARWRVRAATAWIQGGVLRVDEADAGPDGLDGARAACAAAWEAADGGATVTVESTPGREVRSSHG